LRADVRVLLLVLRPGRHLAAVHRHDLELWGDGAELVVDAGADADHVDLHARPLPQPAPLGVRAEPQDPALRPTCRRDQIPALLRSERVHVPAPARGDGVRVVAEARTVEPDLEAFTELGRGAGGRPA